MKYWIASYKGGNTYPATIEKAKEMNQEYDEIDRENLVYFEVYDDEDLILRMHLDDDKRLIYRRREVIKVGRGKKTIWLVGWQKNVNGKNVQAINYIFPDGHIEFAGRWKKGLFCKPNIKDYEKA